MERQRDYVLRTVEERGVRLIRLWFTDVLGQLKSFAISPAELESAINDHPEVVEVMRELGIDLANAKPQKLTAELATGASLLITVGCGEECPYVPGLRRDDWPLHDPKGQSADQVREIRDEIRARVVSLLEREGWGR